MIDRHQLPNNAKSATEYVVADRFGDPCDFIEALVGHAQFGQRAGQVFDDRVEVAVAQAEPCDQALMGLSQALPS